MNFMILADENSSQLFCQHICALHKRQSICRSIIIMYMVVYVVYMTKSEGMQNSTPDVHFSHSVF